MWLAPNICRTDISLMTGTFPCLSTVSLAPFVVWARFFKSTLSQGHLPLCDMHATTPFSVTLNPFWIPFESLLSPFCQQNLDRPHLTSWGQLNFDEWSTCSSLLNKPPCTTLSHVALAHWSATCACTWIACIMMINRRHALALNLREDPLNWGRVALWESLWLSSNIELSSKLHPESVESFS